MATSFESPLALKANTALSAFRLVALSTNGSVGYSTAATTPVGVTGADIPADSFATAKVYSARGNIYPITITGSASTAGALVYAAADGQVAITGSVLVGISAEASGAAGTIVPVVLL